MKKFMIMAAFAATTLTLFSCSKDKKNGVSIVNTSWTYQQDKETEVIKFTSETAANITNNTNGMEISIDATYQYDDPDITINLLGQSVQGTIDGDEMTLKDPDSEETKVYHKD